MKDLSIYIKESQEDGKNGHWEYNTDSNGKGSRIWIDNAEIIKKRKEAEEELKRLAKEKADTVKKKIEQKKKVQKEYEDLEDELYELNQDIKDFHRQYQQLMIDQEEDLGQYMSKTMDDGSPGEYIADELAQEYGEQFNKIEKEIESRQKRINQIEKRLKELEKIL